MKSGSIVQSVILKEGAPVDAATKPRVPKKTGDILGQLSDC
jgi:hypothetical protein